MKPAFAEKLSLTAALLGCATRKELCARFRALNPATEVDLERCYKWLQGRSLPRSARVYEDWARLIGTERSGNWLAACSTEDFLEEVGTLVSIDRDQLRAVAAIFNGGAPKTTPLVDGADYACGAYAAFSWAWSPYRQGQLIRGLLRIDPGKRGRLAAAYEEALPSGWIRCTGTAVRDGSVMHAEVAPGGSDRRDRLFFSLLVPGRPANVLCGLLQGTIINGPEPRPSAGRIVLLRLPGSSELQPALATCYLGADAGSLARDLADSDLPMERAETLAGLVLGFLGARADGNIEQVALSDLAPMAALLDQWEMA